MKLHKAQHHKYHQATSSRRHILNNMTSTLVYFALYAAICLSFCRGQSNSVCRELQSPRYGRLECSTDGSTCSVTCYPGNDLYGKSLLVCDQKTGLWSSNVPYCHPGYSNCESNPKFLCPILTQDDLDAFKQAYSEVAVSTNEILDFEKKLLEGLRSKRSVETRRKALSCHEAFCTKPCAAFPKLRYANLCRICKKRKFCYSIGYSLF